ncbi:MAG TPA: enoyl-CoA hydratase/isomerase family protein [Ilumatobacter sp.]|nr:enoyl-CoA hydratase/isomerase family protein [Ilumatobacter sp.]
MGLINVDHRDGTVLLGLNRPDKRNALDQQIVDEIDTVLKEVQRREPSVLIIHSVTPGMFVSGADIAELIDRDADAALLAINAGLFERLESFRWPTIAAVDGAAFGGGCELALACDFRLCTPAARFAQPELSLGILAGAGANWRLPALVGLGVARRMLFTGQVLDADAAEACGLVDAVVSAEELLPTAMEWAQRIGKRSWRALELTKLSLRQHRPATTGFDLASQALLFESDDKRERMQAFLDK